MKACKELVEANQEIERLTKWNDQLVKQDQENGQVLETTVAKLAAATQEIERLKKILSDRFADDRSTR